MFRCHRFFPGAVSIPACFGAKVLPLQTGLRDSRLNTMYFTAKGQYYVPYLSADGKELYVMVDRPPQPPAQGAPAAAPQVASKTTAQPAASSEAGQKTSGPSAEEAPAVRQVAEIFTVDAGTVLVVRVAADLSSETAHAGDRFQGFLDQDLSADGRLVAPAGTKVYGIVSAADAASKMKGTASLSVTLTDMQVGSSVLSIKTQPVSVKGGTGSGTKKLVGGALLGTAIGAIAGGGKGAAIGAAVGGGKGLSAHAEKAERGGVRRRETTMMRTQAGVALGGLLAVALAAGSAAAQDGAQPPQQRRGTETTAAASRSRSA